METVVIWMQHSLTFSVSPALNMREGKGFPRGSRTTVLPLRTVWEQVGGGGEPTRLCPGERTNGLVSPPRGSSAGPSAAVAD